MALSAVGLVPLDPSVSFEAGLALGPEAIGMDAGSGDIGPYYLGADAEYNPRAWEKNDLEILLTAALERRIPLIVASACGSGTNRAVDEYVDLLREIAAERRFRPFRVAAIYAELSKAYLLERLRRERIEPLGGPAPLRPEDVEATSHVVAMMGVEPLGRALEAGAEVIVAGRAIDDAIHAAYPLSRGIPRATALLLGKLLENASTAATPFMPREAVVASVGRDDVILEPAAPFQRCTRASVVAELFYERRSPLRQAGPGGILDLRGLRLEELDDRRVRVSGATYEATAPYRVKLEGAGPAGFRALSIVGLRSPEMIGVIDTVLEENRKRALSLHPRHEHLPFEMAYHCYGRDAILKARDPIARTPHELAVVIEVLAPTQEVANRVCLFARRQMFLARYEGQKATAGSICSMVDEIVEGLPGYRWTIEHLLPLQDPGEVFPMRIVEM
jgi:hypothetical protein